MKKINLKVVGILVVIFIVIVIIYRVMCKKQRLVQKAKDELNWWAGRSEKDTSTHERLVDYWQKGASFSWINASNILKYDDEYAWSAAGICYVTRKVYSSFPAVSTHAKYTLWAKERKDSGLLSMIAYKPNEYAPVPGDIIVKRRGKFRGDLDTLTPTSTSHGDIVVYNDGNTIRAIGFNLGNTVKEVSYSASNGFLATSNHFAVIKM